MAQPLKLRRLFPKPDGSESISMPSALGGLEPPATLTSHSVVDVRPESQTTKYAKKDVESGKLQKITSQRPLQHRAPTGLPPNKRDDSMNWWLKYDIVYRLEGNRVIGVLDPRPRHYAGKLKLQNDGLILRLIVIQLKLWINSSDTTLIFFRVVGMSKVIDIEL
ncbi:hypothetical protein B0H12DRAFT_1077171 [Mycena haematopus]|nr:hypothetical protein B0H12DRAFT_1077171 [Mycena haematopus]